MKLLARCVTLSAVCIAALALSASSALASTHIWTGASGGAWSTATNWSNNSKPTSNEAGGTIVQFGSNISSTMDISGLVVDQIDFTGSGSTINGSTPLGISGTNLVQNIVSNAGSNTLSSSLGLVTSGAAIEAVSGSGTLTLDSAISGSAGLVLLGGAVVMTPPNPGNTYTGATTLESGTLHINAAVGTAISGSSLTVGTGSGPGASLFDDNSSDIASTTDVTIKSDGAFDFQTHADTAKSLTIDGGRVVNATLSMLHGQLTILHGGSMTVASVSFIGSLQMTGGTISPAAQGSAPLYLYGGITATSGSSGPAVISTNIQLAASPTITVTAGLAPELWLTGNIGEIIAGSGITKSGAGTLVMTGADTYTGTTTVTAGTLQFDGTQSGAFAAAQGGTLSGTGTIGATTVAGTLAPTPPGISTSALSFSPTGGLAEVVTSLSPSTLGPVNVTGSVSIDPAATLSLAVGSSLSIPVGTKLALINASGTAAITGHFANLASGAAINTAQGVPLDASYTGGFALTAAAIPVPVTPVSTPTPPAAPAPAPPTTKTVTTTAFGASFTMTLPAACVVRGSRVSAQLTIKKVAKGSAYKIVKVTKVVFTIGGKGATTVKSAPYRAQLTVPTTASSRSTVKLVATSFLNLHGGSHATKAVVASLTVC